MLSRQLNSISWINLKNGIDSVLVLRLRTSFPSRVFYTNVRYRSSTLFILPGRDNSIWLFHLAMRCVQIRSWWIDNYLARATWSVVSITSYERYVQVAPKPSCELSVLSSFPVLSQYVMLLCSVWPNFYHGVRLYWFGLITMNIIICLTFVRTDAERS